MASPPNSPEPEEEQINTIPSNTRQMTVKDLLRTIQKNRKRGSSMPSTVKRNAERQKKRIQNCRRSSHRSGSGSNSGNSHQDAGRSESYDEINAESEVDREGPAATSQAQNAEADPANMESEEKDPVVMAPKVTIDEDGNIVIDKSSLVISASDPAQQNVGNSSTVTVEASDALRHITSASYSKRESAQRWSKEDNDKFFDALSRFGTDFSLIQHLFPNRSRRQIKLKFKREERENLQKVEMYLKLRTRSDPYKAKNTRNGLDCEARDGATIPLQVLSGTEMGSRPGKSNTITSTPCAADTAVHASAPPKVTSGRKRQDDAQSDKSGMEKSASEETSRGQCPNVQVDGASDSDSSTDSEGSEPQKARAHFHAGMGGLTSGLAVQEAVPSADVTIDEEEAEIEHQRY